VTAVKGASSSVQRTKAFTRRGARTVSKRDYSLVGEESRRAVELGLAAAEWYHSDVPRKRMKELMRRKNGPAVRDTLAWFGLLAGFAVGVCVFWGSWLCVPFLVVYGVLYGSASDSRWHEAGHGTAFRGARLNDALYHVASFMIMREPTLWRWSHARHHTDTIIVGRDREITAMRPPDVAVLLLQVFAIRDAVLLPVSIVRHACGRLTADEKEFIPSMERHRVYREARMWVLVYGGVIASAIAFGSWLPVVLVGLPSLYGRWLSHFFGLTQHAGLAENVLDHRLNSRTVCMNPVFRFLYWNMNYHVEHHMFPMVPYHALPALHAELAHDLPQPYRSTIEAYREILPTLLRQLRDPELYVKRELPATARPFRPELHGVLVETGSR
jgi:fatty acid desaturase